MKQDMLPVRCVPPAPGGLIVIRKEAWLFAELVPVSAFVRSSKDLKDLKATTDVTSVHGVRAHRLGSHSGLLWEYNSG